MDINTLINPTFVWITTALAVLGALIKHHAPKISNKLIPYILGGVGILLAAITALTTMPVGSLSEVAQVALVAIKQGGVCALVATGGHQWVKQGMEMRGERNSAHCNY